MDTHKKNREHVSALADGEVAPADLELASATLGSADGHAAWLTYHRIGDLLRARATPELSAGFSARLADRLAAEEAPGTAPCDLPAAGVPAPAVVATLPL